MNFFTSMQTSCVLQIFFLLMSFAPKEMSAADIRAQAPTTQLTEDLCIGGGLRIGRMASLDTHVIDGHYTGEYSSTYLQSSMEDILFDHEYFLKGRKQPFESLLFVGCGGGKISADGRSGILDLSRQLNLRTYGFNQTIVISDKIDHLKHAAGPNKHRKIFGQSISIYLSDDVDPMLRRFRRSEPNLDLFQVAFPDGQQVALDHPFEHFPRARRVYIHSSYGTTHWIHRNPSATDPLERFAGSFTQMRTSNEYPFSILTPPGMRNAIEPTAVMPELAGDALSMGHLDAFEGGLAAVGIALDMSGSRVSELAVRHDHEGLLGTGVMLQWSGQLLMGQRHSYSDSGLPQLQKMFMTSTAVDSQSALARNVLIPGALSDEVIAQLHGGPSQAELNARIGCHPGWCPQKCSEACPNAYVPGWFGRRMGWAAAPGGPYDRRVNCR